MNNDIETIVSGKRDMLQGRKALVTGGQQGIGAAAAIAMAKAGADVAINWHTDREDAEAVAGKVRACGAQAELVEGDVSTARGASDIVKKAASRLGGMDILVNGASIFPMSQDLNISEEEWDRVMATNLKGTFFCSQTASEMMANAGKGGAIINLSSIAATGLDASPHYAASKGAIISLTRSLAKAYAIHDIRVNAIAPGLIDTTGHKAVVAQSMIPLGRVGDLEDIVGAIVYLASYRADYVTGQTIHVNGGQFMP